MIETKQTAKEAEKAGRQLRISSAEVLRDYSLAVQSRQASLIGRREVLNGRAKFGIFGDGKEVAQIALAKAFRKGDFRSGYYRDQTLMFALGAITIQQFFAQLYAHADVVAEPSSAGRQMNAHFATRSLRDNGTWRDLTKMVNSSADLSPTAAQMPRLVGLGYASRLYRELAELQHLTQFSQGGNEVAFGTIGNASCAEGLFWEAINAIGVLHAPVVLSIWDDEYGISVTNEFQITKANLTEVLSGFQRTGETGDGFDIYTVKGWDYPALIETYARAAENARNNHIPAIVHVIELTQPQGHSTSGSHERYKSTERLAWEHEFDSLRQMRQWIIEQSLAPEGELDQIERNAENLVENFRAKAWSAYTRPIYDERNTAVELIQHVERALPEPIEALETARTQLGAKESLARRDIQAALRDALIALRGVADPSGEPIAELVHWRNEHLLQTEERYSSHVLSQSAESALHVQTVEPIFEPNSPTVPGAKVLNACFDAMLSRDPRVLAFGEDLGHLGGVNQTWAGLQQKYGELRVSDTGIREATIVGQAIGLALRGLRPIAEIQYLDYLLYALQILSDDLATIQWRTSGGQKAPVIISTRGHRLEGVWHAGSPMGSIIHLLRGIHVCVPRDMTQAAAFYNTLLLGDEPGLVVEVLNGYRLKEDLPQNISEITLALGVPEVLREGEDVSIVTYGAACQIAMEAADLLQGVGISAEIIDVQTLLPFDRAHSIVKSLEKTSRIVFLDEDMPGGATAFMMQQVIEEQGGFYWLDSEPRTVTAKAHRPAYGSDGAYFSKPNAEQVFLTIYDMMNEADPARYPGLPGSN